MIALPWLKRTNGLNKPVCRTDASHIAGSGGLHEHWIGESDGWVVASLTQCGIRHLALNCGNEDACACQFREDGGIHVAVADGVGSGSHADLCSHALVRHCVDSLLPQPVETFRVHHCIASGKTAIQHALSRVGAAPDVIAGTMLAALWLDGTGAGFVGHVGDCRAYRWIPNTPLSTLCPLTMDHTYANLGLDTPLSRRPQDPARMVGNPDTGQPDIKTIHIAPGEGVLLCSDGIHGALDDTCMGQCLVDDSPCRAIADADAHVGMALSARLRMLSQAALACGSRDDVTAILLWRRRNLLSASVRHNLIPYFI